MSVQVYLDAIGMVGPGANNWTAWQSLLQDASDYQIVPTVVPALNVLPPAERRRTGAGVKLALATGMEALSNAGIDPATMTTVFCSSGGDGDNCHLICEALAGSDRMISPTRFHNSVHNAPSGYWGIAAGAMLPSTSLCAYDGGFAVGLLEAAVQCAIEKRPVLLVVYDTPYPEPLHATRPILDQYAVALLLNPTQSVQSLGALSLQLEDAACTRMTNTALEQVRIGIPAARGLPLLQIVAQARAAHADLEYVNGRSLHAVFTPVQ
ncbi:beta-ketoacyl synthase chain length factor [Oxalicibacterium faecigallinarum]|uniref:Beta-ketoacyl synthase-like N-terminal domain-containing protein n=1 Tax=Oxalicibacterium faecigallinarum TaxID=573741 RepID=A0A8J3F3T6_9BURK|nr:beta-ketoacyl synthase chain length factor [Oxalicibacterium faecigallinarum]GGI20020.1 hypothetical protein GCM10008066_21940 [Oxalicibacterium faecigallinarum]